MSDENPFRLRYTSIHLIARDRAAKKVLLGGLGGMRVGVMWFDEVQRRSDGSVDERCTPYSERYENWDTVPERKFPEIPRMDVNWP